MKGDYCRYIAENVDRDTKKNIQLKVFAAYNEDLDAVKNIDYKNPAKLGLALNIFCFDFFIFLI